MVIPHRRVHRSSGYRRGMRPSWYARNVSSQGVIGRSGPLGAGPGPCLPSLLLMLISPLIGQHPCWCGYNSFTERLPPTPGDHGWLATWDTVPTVPDDHRDPNRWAFRPHPSSFDDQVDGVTRHRMVRVVVTQSSGVSSPCSATAQRGARAVKPSSEGFCPDHGGRPQTEATGIMRRSTAPVTPRHLGRHA